MIQWDINGMYPLVNIQKAIEAMAIEIVDFPSYKIGGSFHGKMLVHQRVSYWLALTMLRNSSQWEGFLLWKINNV